MKTGANKLAICLFLLLFCGFYCPRQSFALAANWSQAARDDEKKVTLNVTQQTLVRILSEIKKQTGLAYGFKDTKDVNSDEYFSIKVKNVSIDSALNVLFSETKYTYQIVGNLILISTKDYSAQVNSENIMKVKGRVTDENGNPIPGATIVIHGTMRGVASDSDDYVYVFDSWIGVPAGAMQNGNECIISSLDSDLDIDAVYKEKGPETYTVTVNAGDNGTVTDADGHTASTIEVTEGDSVTLKVAADDTFKIKELTVNDTLEEAATGDYGVYELTLDDITENKVVDVSFEKCDVTGIVVKENPDQMTYEDGETFKPDGMVITVTYEDGKTEEIDKGFTCETDPLTPDNNEVTITYEGKETTLDVNVNEKKYIVNVSMTGEGGYPTPLGDTFVTAGDDFSFTVKLNDKYHKVESITVKRGDSTAKTIDSEAFAESESYTVDDINSDVVITVTFAERDVIGLEVEGINDSYKVGESINNITVTAKYEGNDNVTKELDSNEYTINPNLPYTFQASDVDNGVDVVVTYNDNNDIKWDKHVTVEQNLYTVTVVSNHGTAQDGNVTAGGDFTFTVTDIEAGYEVTGATVTAGSDKAGTPKVEGNTITVPNVQGNITVTVQFAKKQYDVTINIVNPSFGTVKDTINDKTLANRDTITVEHGEDVELEITPANGHRIAKVEGTTSGNSGNYKLENVTGPATITVTFEKIPVVTGIEIVDGSFKDEYTCYDKLDLNGMQIKVIYDNGKSSETITITDNSQLIINHVDQTGWWDDVENQYEGGQWVGGIILGYQKGGHWVAKFNITYKDFTDSIEVKVTCGDNSDRTYDCRYCPNWDGMNSIARSTRSAKAHFSTESKG